MAQKRTLDSFFQPRAKEPRLSRARPPHNTDSLDPASSLPPSTHPAYPFPISHLPKDLIEELSEGPATPGTALGSEPDLDVLHYTPYVPRAAADSLFAFLRRELPFYRVQYSIKRGNVDTQINTPRYTTVFGVDTSATFTEHGKLVSTASKTPLPDNYYRCKPRPIPACLDVLRVLTEAATGATFNFVLVNYYACGNDSISYHSDDENFLGPEPTIASFSLGAMRDFCLKHKPKPGSGLGSERTLKLPLNSGDMVLMRGRTQACWLHSIPKRKLGVSKIGGNEGRINITFRKALVRGGTENYYRYNVGDAKLYRWNGGRKAMVP
jgi:alkylated DNA repair dioxygenase AlkB